MPELKYPVSGASSSRCSIAITLDRISTRGMVAALPTGAKRLD